MQFRIHFTNDESDDSFVVSGETMEDVRGAVEVELSRRGLDAERNNCWSEEVGRG